MVLAVAAASATRADAVLVRVFTENDYMTRNPTNDDMYTFALGVEVEHRPYVVSFRENAFTDREAGGRFDETYLTVRRAVPRARSWGLRVELGAVHVGRGLFGQELQNAFHRLIGDDELHLRYVSSSLRALAGLTAGRTFLLSGRFGIGPHVEARAIPGFRTDALAGLRTSWRSGRHVALDLLTAERYSHTSLALLEPHLTRFAPLVRVELTLQGSVAAAWTYNDYGDRRQHVSIGYRFRPGAMVGR